MKRIEIAYIDTLNKESPLSLVSDTLNVLKRNLIDEVPWQAFAYKPEVAFAMAYNNCIFIKFFVSEKSIRAAYSNVNEPVYKDSCVEFFISFNGEAEYYNLEFNCIGTCLLGYGTGRSPRNLLPEKLINTIKHHAFINTSNDFGTTGINWELTLLIPLEVFAYHKICCLKGTVCKGNFFKCGDDLKEPHFLAWNTIKSEFPDFHLPRFFGDLAFM